MSFLPRLLSRSRSHPYARGMGHFNRLEFREAAEEFDRYLAEEKGGSSPDLQLARFYAAEAHAKLGICHYRRGDFVLARAELERAALTQASYPDLYAYLGILNAREGRLEESLASLDYALDLSPHQREALAARIVVLSRLEREDDASHDLAHLAALGLPLPEPVPPAVRVPAGRRDPAPPPGRGTRGVTLPVDGADRHALGVTLRSIEEGITDHPGYADLRCRAAEILALLGRRGEALAAYDAALALHPEYLDAHLGRGITLLALGRAGEARTALARAGALRPHYADVAYYEGVAHAWSGGDGDAVGAFTRALALNPGFWRARLALAEIVLLRGDRGRALAELEAALDCHTPQASRWGKEGAAAHELEECPDPVDLLACAVRAHPDYPDYRTQLGTAHFERGNLEAARGELEEAARLNPGYADAFTVLGEVEIAAGRPEVAAGHMARAAALAPERADVQFILGEAKREAGDEPGSAAAYREALILNPSYVDALVALAGFKERQRRGGEARGLYRKALALAPGHPLAAAGLAGEGEEGGSEEPEEGAEALRG